MPEQVATPTYPSLVDVIARGVMDAELAALVWVLVEGRIPLIVAAPPGRLGAGGQLLAGVIGSIHPDEDVVAIQQALTPVGANSLTRGRRAGGVLEAVSLGEVRERLGGGPLPMSPDQLTFLGTVLVLGDGSTEGQEAPGAGSSSGRQTGSGSAAGSGEIAASDTGSGEGTGSGHAAEASSRRGARGRLRVTAAHYVRPLARDAHGHAQRLDPAVLATWDARLQRYEHFAWGVLPEIAARLGRKAGDLEADLHHRRDDLAGLAKAGITSLAEVRRLVAGYRIRYGESHDAHGEAH